MSPSSRLPLRSFLLTLPFIAARPLAPAHTGNVLVVDAGGSGLFSQIQPAVDAAQDGDVVLVRSGTYGPVVIHDKSLTVVGDTGAIVQIHRGLRVQDVPPSKTVVLSNLRSFGDWAFYDPKHTCGLFLDSVLGHFRAEACEFYGGRGGTLVDGHAVSVRDCADVALVACILRGGAQGPDGLHVAGSSTVTVYGCSVEGGRGRDESCSGFHAGNGGDGGDVQAAFLFSSNSLFEGGRGGDIGAGSIWSCPWAGDGGDGIRATNATIYLLDSAAIRGPGGTGSDYTCGDCAYPGYAGSDRSGATIADLPGSARMLVSPTPVRAQTTQSLTLRGEPGDRVGILVSPRAATAQLVGPWHGMLLVALDSLLGSAQVLPAGIVPASGVLRTSVTIPALPGGSPSGQIFLQALFVDTQGQRYLSGARSMTVLP